MRRFETFRNNFFGSKNSSEYPEKETACSSETWDMFLQRYTACKPKSTSEPSQPWKLQISYYKMLFINLCLNTCMLDLQTKQTNM